MSKKLPTLIMNGRLIRDLMAEQKPCCAVGLVEEGNRSYAFVALRPPASIPADVTAGGFNFGHAVLGTAAYEVIQFAFEFYGFAVYHVLLNPNNRVTQTVLGSMMETGKHYFFAIGPEEHVTAFRSDVGRDTLAGLKDNRDRIRLSTTSETQYQDALAQFRKQPTPPGRVLDWVCHHNIEYLDLSRDRLEMTPSS